MSTATLSEQFTAEQSSRDADKQAAYMTVLRRHVDHRDTDPGDMLDVCEAAGKTADDLQHDLDDLEERNRLAGEVASTAARRKARDKAQSELVKADKEIAAAEKRLLAARDDRSSCWSKWSIANNSHNDARRAAGTLKQERYSRFDTPDESAEREVFAENEAAAKARREEISAARQRVADTDHTLAAHDRETSELASLLAYNQQRPRDASAEIIEQTTRLTTLRDDRKELATRAGKARSKLLGLESQ